LLRTLAAALDDARLRDDGEAALAATKALVESGAVDAGLAARAVPERFLRRHDTSREAVYTVFERALRDVSLVQDTLPLIEIDDIDSFADVASVSHEQVAKLSYPLQIAEDHVKAALHEILGEPFQTPHSPAELSDINTSTVVLDGRRVRAALLLKGPGLGKATMQVRDLGTQGNQIVKLSRSEAQLMVVQFVGQISEDVITHLRQAVVDQRLSGNNAVGSVWNGADTARLLVARGWLDLKDGVYSGPTTIGA
jgi:hypothetical protein